jgi:3-isopropylmalate dehydrogenase
VRLGLIEGDGIGPEVVQSARDVADDALRAAGAAAIDWMPLPMGQRAIMEYGDPLPYSTLEALEELDGWLLGPHDSASYAPHHRTGAPPGGAIRKRFGLYANIRPVRAFAGVWSGVQRAHHQASTDMDLVIVRENSEGFYADRNMFSGSGEFQPTPDVAMSVGVFSRAAIERVAHEACRLARSRRSRLTIVHKANALPMTMGLFRDVCYEVATDYPGLTVDNEHVDAAAAHLVRAPGDYDVLVTENLFGDILSDLAAELGASLGTAPSLNCSRTQAMAQAVHGAAPVLAGRNRANPAAMQLSTAMLLRWLGSRGTDTALLRAAERIERAVAATFEAGIATADLGGLASTSEFTEQVRARVHRW